MQSRLLLNIVVRQGTTVLELFTSKDKALLVRRNAFFILDLRLHVVDGIRRLDLQRNRLASESLDKDLHTTAKTEDEVEGRLLLDVVIRESTTVFKLFASENKALLIGGDSFLVLNLRLHVIDCVGRLDFQGDRLASERLDKDLHTAAQTKDEVKGRLFLDVIVGQRPAVFELLSSKDKTLLIGRNAEPQQLAPDNMRTKKY